MLPGKKLLRILPDEGHGGSWGGWDRDEENVSEEISRTVDGPLSEATQDRLWTSLTAIYKAHVFAPETIPTVLTAFDETGSSMTVTATSSRAPEATKLYSRNSKPGKRDWRRAYYAGEPVCGPEGIPGIMAGVRLDMTPFNLVESNTDVEQTLNLESTEDDIWDGGFIDFIFTLEGEEFVTSSLPGITPSERYVSEPCSNPMECQGCLV